MSGSNDVYELKGLAPEKAILIKMNTPTPSGKPTVMLGGTFTAYREEK